MTSPDPAELAKLIVSRFIERRDVKAIQTGTGAYMPVRADMRDPESDLIPFKLSDVVDHVEGRKTYGHYVVNPASDTCRTFVFDIDLRKKANTARGETPILFDGEEIDPRAIWAAGDSPAKRDLAMQLRVIAEGLAKRTRSVLGGDVPVMVSYSGSKGMHVYGCLDPGTPATHARLAAESVIDSLDGLIVPDHGKNFFKHAEKFQAISIELFPKQTEVGDGGFGNLIRLPLGMNRKSGKKGFFLDMNTPQDQFKIDDPIKALREGSFR